jgi:exonuclease SbcC
MRPIRLELKGFTAFREKCEVDFSKFDLFAITGQTGAGKTSLLDAMTYALYGKTSRLNKAGKDLISQGANSMSVLLHFRVGGKEYRVLRTIKGSAVAARLEIRENEEWKPAVGSITEVNDQIQRIVGLDFGGFTKTVILPQGKFDVFLRGEPKERREVLAELLDVEVYQRMVKTANEKAKGAGIRAEERTANIDASATPEAMALAEQRLEDLSKKKAVAAAARQTLVKSLSTALPLREKRHALLNNQGELEATVRRYAETESAAATARGQVHQQSEALLGIDRQIEATPYDGDLHLRFNGLLPQAQQQHRLGEQLASDQVRLKAKNTELGEAMKAAVATRERARIETERLETADRERRDAASLLKDLQLKHGSVDAISLTIKDIESALKEAAGIPAITGQIDELGRRADVLSAQIEAAGMSVVDAEQTLADADKLYEGLHARDRGAALRHELKPGEQCPVCEQTVHTVPAAPDSGGLAQAGKDVAEARATVKRRENRRLELSNEAQGIPARIDFARAQAEGLQKRLDQAYSRVQMLPEQRVEQVIPVLRALVNEIKAADFDAQQAKSRYEVADRQQRDAATALQSAEHGKALRESEATSIGGQIETLERDLLAVGKALKDAPTLQEITAQIKALDAARAKRAELEGKRKTYESDVRRLKECEVTLGETLAGLKSRKAGSEAAIEELQKEVVKLGRQLKKVLGEIVLAESPDEATQIERMEQAGSKELEALQGDVQRCRFEIEDIAKRMERNRKLVLEIAELKAESALYRDLGSWLNAGNFQQYLLGSAFEVLAKEGSKHLRKLSSDRYDFVFEGDEFMVSDHSNADETRSVKTLSGGESFLASLSLALALAESITQLNGEQGALSLESLFLDEGFSTLDSETLTKVADAIELLQDGNRLIGIITHVQSLADQMPVRIEIEKTVAGSRIVPQSEVRAFSA